MVTRFLTNNWNKNFYPYKMQIDLSDHPFIKYDISDVTVIFPPRGTTMGIVSQYCEHHNMYYISQLKINSPQNRALT